MQQGGLTQISVDIKELRNIIQTVLFEYRSAMGTTDGQNMQHDLDWERFITPSGMFGPETQAQTAEFNDNINRELKNKVDLDGNTWSRMPSANRNMFTEDEINELFPNAATMKGEALPHEPKIPLHPNEDRKDQLTIQLRKQD